jgi:hypothetical protein
VKKNTQVDEYKYFIDTMFSRVDSKSSYSPDSYNSQDESEYFKEKGHNKNNNLSIFNTNFMNIINNIPYLNRINNYGLNYDQKSVKSELYPQSPINISPTNNYNNLFMGHKKTDKILHIDLALYVRYSFLFERM